MSKVEYNNDNIIRCMCSECPVQSDSACVEDKMETIERNDENAPLPKPEDFPGVYCSSGVSSCKEIDTDRVCMCGGCSVWKENDLAVGKIKGHFCRDGAAV